MRLQYSSGNLMIKQCSECKLIKNVSEFYYRKKKHYYEGKCRECHALRMQEWRKGNEERNKINDRRYAKSDKRKKWRDEYRKRPEVLVRERAQTISYRNQPDNHEKRIEYLNKPEVNKRTNELKRKRRENINIKLNDRISGAINHSIRNGKNGLHWETLVGYTLEDLKWHLEHKFQMEMTWDNYKHSGWHIDHIIPISRFNFSSYNDIDFKRCWALSNLQPMWGKENMSKGNKITEPFQPCLTLELSA